MTAEKNVREALEFLLSEFAEYKEHSRVPDADGCSDHEDAPHGFDRNGSHSADRYVCDCEGWSPDPADSKDLARHAAYFIEKHGPALLAALSPPDPGEVVSVPRDWDDVIRGNGP